jgi:hypothetical protein
MSGELEVLLRLVAEGRLTADEAAPIVAALEEKSRQDAAQAATWPSIRDALSGRHITVYVAENGRPVINLSIPLAAAGFAIDQVPGLSPDHRSRIVEAIQRGLTGPILEVSDHGDEVRITIE